MYYKKINRILEFKIRDRHFNQFITPSIPANQVGPFVMVLSFAMSDLGLHCLPRPVCLKTSDHFLVDINFVWLPQTKH